MPAFTFFCCSFKKACSQEPGGNTYSSQQGFRTQLGSSFPSLQRGRRGQHHSQVRKRHLADSSGAVKPGSHLRIHLSIPAFSPDQAPCNYPVAWYLPCHRPSALGRPGTAKPPQKDLPASHGCADSRVTSSAFQLLKTSAKNYAETVRSQKSSTLAGDII